jgi:hypothetical protein
MTPMNSIQSESTLKSYLKDMLQSFTYFAHAYEREVIECAKLPTKRKRNLLRVTFRCPIVFFKFASVTLAEYVYAVFSLIYKEGDGAYYSVETEQGIKTFPVINKDGNTGYVNHKGDFVIIYPHREQ